MLTAACLYTYGALQHVDRELMYCHGGLQHMRRAPMFFCAQASARACRCMPAVCSGCGCGCLCHKGRVPAAWAVGSDNVQQACLGVLHAWYLVHGFAVVNGLYGLVYNAVAHGQHSLSGIVAS